MIEDWELWGDPREIERRRAERAFAALPVEQQRAALAAEYVASRAWAAAAKAAGDRTKQREAGQLIGALKAEMHKLGLSEADAAALATTTSDSGGSSSAAVKRGVDAERTAAAGRPSSRGAISTPPQQLEQQQLPEACTSGKHVEQQQQQQQHDWELDWDTEDDPQSQQVKAAAVAESAGDGGDGAPAAATDDDAIFELPDIFGDGMDESGALMPMLMTRGVWGLAKDISFFLVCQPKFGVLQKASVFSCAPT